MPCSRSETVPAPDKDAIGGYRTCLDTISQWPPSLDSQMDAALRVEQQRQTQETQMQQQEAAMKAEAKVKDGKFDGAVVKRTWTFN